MKYIYLIGAMLFAALFGGLTKLVLDPMISDNVTNPGMLYQAAQLADNNTYSGASFGGEFELLFFTALPWILPAAWVVWIFLKMGKGDSQ